MKMYELMIVPPAWCITQQEGSIAVTNALSFRSDTGVGSSCSASDHPPVIEQQQAAKHYRAYTRLTITLFRIQPTVQFKEYTEQM